MSATRATNPACTDCHVNAGPARTESMSRETLADVLAYLDTARVHNRIPADQLASKSPDPLRTSAKCDSRIAARAGVARHDALASRRLRCYP